MKKLVLSIGLLLGSWSLFAQANVVDSSQQIAKNTQLALKNNEGSKMLHTDDATTNIYNSPEFWSFYRAIKFANLSETIRSRGPLTVFAPDNDAFAKMPRGKMDSLLNTKRLPDLIAMVTYHVIPGILKAKDIIHEINTHNGTATFTTLTGNKLRAKLDANRNIVLIDENGGQSVISKFDITQNNGVLHIINAVLIPKFKDI
ncbi:fasciclin domain-containing protein [Mucilaginibacter panaciglaebae]|uniref:Fasciclin domain-containing protein n=1 Tax=Mucilaginibacter panaciglaebae TaxID=502331 RepID=A0ABP7WJL0_9SPHI